MLRQADVLDELPDRVRQAGRHGAAHVRRHVRDRCVEADARVFPVEHPRQMIANRGVGAAARHYEMNALPSREARVALLICRSNPFGVVV